MLLVVLEYLADGVVKDSLDDDGDNGGDDIAGFPGSVAAAVDLTEEVDKEVVRVNSYKFI